MEELMWAEEPQAPDLGGWDGETMGQWPNDGMKISAGHSHRCPAILNDDVFPIRKAVSAPDRQGDPSNLVTIWLAPEGAYPACFEGEVGAIGILDGKILVK